MIEAMPAQSQAHFHRAESGTEAVPSTPSSTPPCTPPPTPSCTKTCQHALPVFNNHQADHIGSAVVKLITRLKLEGQFVEILREELWLQLEETNQETYDKIALFTPAEAVGAARCAVKNLRAEAKQASLGQDVAATGPTSSPPLSPITSTVKGSYCPPDAVELPFPTFLAHPALPAGGTSNKAGDACRERVARFQKVASVDGREAPTAAKEASQTKRSDKCQEEEAQQSKEEAQESEALGEQHLGGQETHRKDVESSSGTESIQQHGGDLASRWQMLAKKQAEKFPRETQAMARARREEARSHGHPTIKADRAKKECTAAQEALRKMATDPSTDTNLPRSLSTWSQRKLLQMRSTLLPQTKQAMLSTLSETLMKLESDRQKLPK